MSLLVSTSIFSLAFEKTNVAIKLLIFYVPFVHAITEYLGRRTYAFTKACHRHRFEALGVAKLEIRELKRPKYLRLFANYILNKDRPHPKECSYK